MGFQTSINTQLAYGVVGEVAFDGPLRAAPYTLDSAVESNNVIGRAFTIKSEGVAEAGGTGVFAGIMIAPKSYAYAGLPNEDSGDLTCSNGSTVELCTMGIIYVKLPGAAAIGAAVKFNNTTGVLGTGAPGAGETAVPNAKVTDFTVGGAGLAVITLTN